MWYILLVVVALVFFFFLKSFRKINNLSEDGSLLVAFTKQAMQTKTLLKDNPNEDQYENLLRACYLFNCFIKKTDGIRGDYNFSIIENGPVYGTVFNVQLTPFIETIRVALKRKANSLPIEYRKKIELYMNAPFSEEGKMLSEKAVSMIVSDDDMDIPYLKQLRKDYIKGIRDMDFMFTLFK